MLIFNNGLESLNEASFVLGMFLNIEENDACFFFASSGIFPNADNVSEAFLFFCICYTQSWNNYRIQNDRNSQAQVKRSLEQARGEKCIHLLCYKNNLNYWHRSRPKLCCEFQITNTTPWEEDDCSHASLLTIVMLLDYLIY